MPEQPEVTRSEVHASGDAVEPLLRRNYVDFRTKSSPAHEESALDISRTIAGDLMWDRVRHSVAMSVATEPFSLLQFLFPLEGRLEMRAPGQELLMQPGDAVLTPLGVPVDVDWTPYDVEVLSVPVEVAERAADEAGAHGPLRFLGTAPVSAAADRLWRSTAGFVASQMDSPRNPLSEPLAQAQALDLIGAAVVEAFPNTTMTLEYRPGPGQVAPIGVRQAVDYIEAHAASPIALSDIAGAVHASPEAVMHAFDLHYGFGPMEYLRRVRLERAHLDLRTADPAVGATVASIAAHWGFLNVHRFSRAYFEMYRQPPGQTLRVHGPQ